MLNGYGEHSFGAKKILPAVYILPEAGRASTATRGKMSSLSFFLSLLFFFFLLPFTRGTPIKNIVVLVLENRSFDHVLGWMKKSINPSINGLKGTECNHMIPSNKSSPSICVSEDADFTLSDPPHSFSAVKTQIYGSDDSPTMSGFLESALSSSPTTAHHVMKGFPPEKLPSITTLAENFAIFERWFSSLPGPTQPNRLFLFSATSHGAIAHHRGKLARGYPQKTIFDSLHDEGLDFGIYSESLPCALFLRNLRKVKYATKFHRFRVFKKHAREGKLKSLSLVEPRYFDLMGAPADDDHPAHDVANGQRLVKEVYEAVRSGPQWNETLLVITYDEHGGFFDHVPTPDRGVPPPDSYRSPPPERFGFDRLGVRVPTIMVSPWIVKGTVFRTLRKVVGKAAGPTESSEYEHSSIPATVRKIFNLRSPFLTRRDAWAGTFDDIVSTLSSPRIDCPEVLPEVTPLRPSPADEEAELSDLQLELVQLAADIHGDEAVSKKVKEVSGRMTVRQASEYVDRAMARFLQAGRKAQRIGVNGSFAVDVWAAQSNKKSLNLIDVS